MRDKDEHHPYSHYQRQGQEARPVLLCTKYWVTTQLMQCQASFPHAEPIAHSLGQLRASFHVQQGLLWESKDLI